MTTAGDHGAMWERWAEVDRLLEQVLDLPEHTRPVFLTEVAEADAELAAMVARLVDRLVDTERVSSPSGALVAAAFARRETETILPGHEIGRFRVIERLGKGGMATVYLAERADGTYDQRVALKVLRRGLDSENLVRRFVTERQILSSLSHPNIARLLDGGSTPDGRPYLVMDLVEGEPITTWADSHQLDVAARLDLFLAMTDAIDAAHRQLVVHRDIKPSNVLVDADGRVKLLDFGIATLLDGEVAETDGGVLPLTPTYASPEQRTGGQITTASDIYQAGLLLFELLTGTRPRRGWGGDPLTSPLPNHGVPPDVGWIIAKSMREDPNARYVSMSEMAVDVRRHLSGFPVLAHPESTRYRFSKFRLRHPTLLPVVLFVLVLLVGYIVTLHRHNTELVQERDAASEALALATETRDFFVDLFRAADPYAPADATRGRNITVIEALQLGRTKLDADLVDRPRLRAELLSTVGEVFRNLDQIDAAAETLEHSISIRTDIGDTVSAEFLRNLETLGSTYLTRGEPDQARRMLERELRLARKMSPPDAERLSAALRMNALLESPRDPQAALPLNREAVAVARAEGGVLLAEALRKLADNLRNVGDLGASESAAREAVALFRGIEGDSSIRTGFAVHTLGQTLSERGQFDEAGGLFDWSLAILDHRLGRSHDLTMRMRNNLGVFYLEAGRWSDAESVFRQLLTDRIAQFGPQSDQAATSHQNLAALLIRQGRLAEADAEARHAARIYAGFKAGGGYWMAFPLLTRADIALARSDYLKGFDLAHQAAALLRDKVSTDNPAAIMADCRMGRAEAGLGQTVAARAHLESAVTRLERLTSSSEAHLDECRQALVKLETD